MLKFKITTRADLDEAAKVQRRRQFEEERKKSIYNAKKRLFGLDRKALESQITDQKIQRKKQEEQEQAFIDERMRQADLQKLHEMRLENERRLHEAEINCYRSTYQRKNQSSTFYLNDPNLNKMSGSYPKSRDDARFGISSAQIFAGDVPKNSDWKRVQKEQQMAWLDQQVDERRFALEERKQADKLIDQRMDLKEHRLKEMAAIEKEQRMNVTESVKQYNQNMAARQKAERLESKKQIAKADQAEIQNTLGSDMLMEKYDVAESRTSLKKKIAYQYRGMTPDERKEFYKERTKQMKDDASKKLDDEVKEKQWEQQTINMSKIYGLDCLKREKKMKQELREQQNFNIQLAKEQKERIEDSKKYARQIAATEEFFAQFNKGAR